MSGGWSPVGVQYTREGLLLVYVYLDVDVRTVLGLGIDL